MAAYAAIVGKLFSDMFPELPPRCFSAPSFDNTRMARSRSLKSTISVMSVRLLPFERMTFVPAIAVSRSTASIV